jgi:hypothetical protein
MSSLFSDDTDRAERPALPAKLSQLDVCGTVYYVVQTSGKALTFDRLADALDQLHRQGDNNR